MKNIVLIGFMGTGKSTIAHCLSEVYGYEVLEMDEEIVRREGMSIPDLFETKGESYFRNLETSLLIEMQSRENMVISCGGGAALREKNVEEMKKNGKVVLLTAQPETILERVKDDENRPLLKGNKNLEFIQDLMEKRREKYEASADIMLAVDGKCVQDICSEMMELLGMENTLKEKR